MLVRKKDHSILIMKAFGQNFPVTSRVFASGSYAIPLSSLASECILFVSLTSADRSRRPAIFPLAGSIFTIDDVSCTFANMNPPINSSSFRFLTFAPDASETGSVRTTFSVVESIKYNLCVPSLMTRWLPLWVSL
jgi:hypothetical protein